MRELKLQQLSHYVWPFTLKMCALCCTLQHLPPVLVYSTAAEVYMYTNGSAIRLKRW